MPLLEPANAPLGHLALPVDIEVDARHGARVGCGARESCTGCRGVTTAAGSSGTCNHCSRSAASGACSAARLHRGASPGSRRVPPRAGSSRGAGPGSRLPTAAGRCPRRLGAAWSSSRRSCARAPRPRGARPRCLEFLVASQRRYTCVRNRPGRKWRPRGSSWRRWRIFLATTTGRCSSETPPRTVK